MKIKKINEVIKSKVYTESGDFFGEVEEITINNNKVEGWKIRVGGSIISLIGGAKGVIVPHQFVKAASDIIIINKTILPNQESSMGSLVDIE